MHTFGEVRLSSSRAYRLDQSVLRGRRGEGIVIMHFRTEYLVPKVYEVYIR